MKFAMPCSCGELCSAESFFLGRGCCSRPISCSTLAAPACSFPSPRGGCRAVRAMHWRLFVGSYVNCIVVVEFPFSCGGLYSAGFFCLFLSYSLLGSGRAGLLVSFPERRVSCRPGHVLEPELWIFNGMCEMQSGCGYMRRRFPPRLRATSAGLLVSFPEGMVSCKPGTVLVWHPPDFCCVKYLLQCWCGCLGRRIPWWRQCMSAVDQAGV